MDEQIELGNRIKEFLNLENLTQTALSEIVGVKQGYLNQVVKGHKRISATVIFGIAKRFKNLNLNWLIRGHGDMFLHDGLMSSKGDEL
jgi:transcriptional regulator with XRE-family HTH domain